MSKRKKLVLESLLLTFGFFTTQLVDLNFRYVVILVLGLITYFLTFVMLKKDLVRVGWLVVLIPPAFYTIFASLFYFLLPSGFLIRSVILIFFSISIYAILLTNNIFSIASKFKSMPLLRAAQAIGFLGILITAFFGYNTVFSFKLNALYNMFLIFIISFPLVMSSIWSVILEEKLTKPLISYSFVLSLIISQLTFFISFWPLTIMTSSLFLISFLYVILGIIQSYFKGRLFKNTLKEFLQVGVMIFIITFFLAHWR